jgi:hypothetical protein
MDFHAVNLLVRLPATLFVTGLHFGFLRNSIVNNQSIYQLNKGLTNLSNQSTPGSLSINQGGLNGILVNPLIS